MGKPGSPQTVQRLVDEHYVALYRYAYRLSGSSADAEDLTQDAFCKAQLNFGQLRDPSRAKPWLFSILRNAYLHRVRADRQQHCVPLDGVGDVAEPLPRAAAGHRPGTLAAGSQRVAGSVSDADYPVLFRGFWLSRDRRADGSADRYGDVSFGAGQGPSPQPAPGAECRSYWPMAAPPGGRPMDCKTARLLLDFARPQAHELVAGRSAALESHLDRCPDCHRLARERTSTR